MGNTTTNSTVCIAIAKNDMIIEIMLKDKRYFFMLYGYNILDVYSKYIFKINMVNTNKQLYQILVWFLEELFLWKCELNRIKNRQWVAEHVVTLL